MLIFGSDLFSREALETADDAEAADEIRPSVEGRSGEAETNCVARRAGTQLVGQINEREVTTEFDLIALT
ncbi:hypothetical protein ACQR0Y_25155 [Bradyrhizobium oligotrophicum]|uniref:hypothetical protein n=1 Tax=Bradyrhizobium TaxID=374 RepID=UPI002916D298|nr:hypothetical protein [Bradyrhizobium sp. SZCCHNR3003]